jgi:uncharacterized protein (DUF608 family)
MAVKRISYSRRELRSSRPARTFSGRNLDEIAFPLGGIGTGSVALGGNGSLRDWEIFNRPNKGQSLHGAFFALWVKPQGKPAVARVLKGPEGGSYAGQSGVDRSRGAGLAHFRSCRFTGRMPFARVELSDPTVPVEVALEAFNPFIPLNDKDSGLPVAIFLYQLTNRAKVPVKATLSANLPNVIGLPECEENVNEFASEGGARGLRMSSRKHEPASPRFGTMALATPWRRVSYLTRWPAGHGFDQLNRFWQSFRETGKFAEGKETAAGGRGAPIGALGLHVSLRPGETATLPVVIAWHFPNFEKYWGQESERPVWKNYYATLWEDAWGAASYAIRNLKRLEGESRAFEEAVFESSLPGAVVDAIASQASILKTTTCLRLSDGTFYGFEGGTDKSGCCEGTCTHVWNYAQSQAYLFPALERSAREADYRYNLSEDGHMNFRIGLPLGEKRGRFHAAADGQLGGILKAYRDWMISGEEGYLRRIWPAMKEALAYAWREWDKDRDGVMEGIQHNTYDIEFWGPNTMLGSFYLGALRAAEELARHLGEEEQAEEYRRLFASGRAWMDEHLFNGEWYEQQVNPAAKPPGDGPQGDENQRGEPIFQYGPGCLSDQLIGQWYAHMLGLGYLFDPARVKKAMASIFKHNWREEFFSHDNPQRIYALEGEKGLLLCSWPRGGRPASPFFYSDEVWTGIEYQVASHLIYEGMVDEGLAIVKGVRDRHDGSRRNPWNEFECGHHYARAMSSYSLLLALSGFHYWAPEQRLGFAPRLKEKDFACFWCVGSGWGRYQQRLAGGKATASLSVAQGSLTLRRLELPGLLRRASRVSAAIGGRAVKVKLLMEGAVEFSPAVRVGAGRCLKLTARRG